MDLVHVDEAGFAPTLPTGSSWGPVGGPLIVPYEAPQGRRVNVIGARFTHGPEAGKFQFASFAQLPKSRSKNPPPLAERAAKFDLTEDEVGRIDAEVFLAFLWTVAGRPVAEAGEAKTWKRERPVWFVLDNYSVHGSERVQAERLHLEAAGIHLFYLPAYTPELSRIEAVWQDVKYQGLPQRSHDHLGALKRAVDTALASKALQLRSVQ